MDHQEAEKEKSKKTELDIKRKAGLSNFLLSGIALKLEARQEECLTME